MNARYYVGSIGRFASADSIVPNPTNPQSYNRYSYVGNRPLNFSDPTGHCGQIASINGNEESLIQDPNDIECWEQYDQRYLELLERRSRSNEVFERGLSPEQIIAEILQELGDGSDWVYQKPPTMCGDGNGNYPCGQEDVYRPCREWEECYDPVGDYAEIGINGFIGGQLTIDQWGNIYVNVHVSTSPGISANVGNIKIRDENGNLINIEDIAVDQQEQVAQNFLTGFSNNLCASGGIGGCLVLPEVSRNHAIEGGMSFPPGVGYSYGHTWLIYDANQKKH